MSYAETLSCDRNARRKRLYRTLPENPNVSARCVDAADIIPTAKEQDERNRHDKTAVCPKCGKPYRGYPTMSRAESKTEICPECGTREVLAAAWVDKAEQDKIITEIQKAAAGV